LLCEVEGGRLRVTGTDNEVTVRTYLEVEALEEGATVIPAKLAADAVRKLPTGAVSITAADGEVEITGNGPRFRLRGLSVGDYPKIDDDLPGETVDVVGETLVKALSQVGIAASGDEELPRTGSPGDLSVLAVGAVLAVLLGGLAVRFSTLNASESTGGHSRE
jgi:DNA polymerase-3 subunit beta